MRAGHWGWFLIAGCSALLTSTIAGLFAFIDDDIRSLTWLPRFFRENPFFVGFLLLHVPTATAAACKGALEVHESEKRNLHRSKVRCRFRLCSTCCLLKCKSAAAPTSPNLHRCAEASGQQRRRPSVRGPSLSGRAGTVNERVASALARRIPKV